MAAQMELKLDKDLQENKMIFFNQTANIPVPLTTEHIILHIKPQESNGTLDSKPDVTAMRCWHNWCILLSAFIKCLLLLSYSTQFSFEPWTTLLNKMGSLSQKQAQPFFSTWNKHSTGMELLFITTFANIPERHY